MTRVEPPGAEAADAVVADESARQAEDARGALLRAELEDTFVTADCFAQGPVFGEVEAHGFFEVDVFAGADGGQGREDVPVIGGGDEDGVEVLAGDQFAEVMVGGAIPILVVLIDPVAGLLEVGGEDIAEGNNAGVLLAQEVAHDALALGAQADAADGDAAAGGDLAGPAEGGRGREGGQGGGGEGKGGGLSEELAAGWHKLGPKAKG